MPPKNVTPEKDDFEDTFNSFAAGETPPKEDEIKDDVPAEDEANLDKDNLDGGDEVNLGDDAAKDNDDILAGLSDAQLAHVNNLTSEVGNLKHRNLSDSGRIRAYQAKVDGLEKDIDGIRKDTPANTEGDKPSEKELKDALSGDDADWNEFKEEYPEVATAIDRRFAVERESMNGEIGKVKAQIKPLHESAEQTQNKNNISLLETPKEDGGFGHEDFIDAINSPEFSEWQENQPVAIQELANSSDPADAASMIDYFKATTGYGQDKNENLDLPPNKDADEAAKLAASRKQKLVDSQSVSGKGTASTAIPEDDFESAFDIYAK